MTYKDEKGAALVEMAISLTLLLLILFGIIEFGRVFYIKNSLTNAAREGARRASVCATWQTKDITDVKTMITDDLAKTSFDTTGLVIDVTPPADTAMVQGTSSITVVVSQKFHPLLPVPGLSDKSIILSGQASMVYE